MASKGLFLIDFLLKVVSGRKILMLHVDMLFEKNISLGFNYNPWDPCMPYMVTFTINIIPQMLAYIPYMDPMGNVN
jgi:hypothetical protein